MPEVESDPIQNLTATFALDQIVRVAPAKIVQCTGHLWSNYLRTAQFVATGNIDIWKSAHSSFSSRHVNNRAANCGSSCRSRVIVLSAVD